MNTHGILDSKGITVVNCTELQMVYLGTSKKPGSMVESFLKSVDPSNLRELVFELIWDKYENDDITSVIDIPAWESIDGALCTLASRIRERHSERRLTVVLSLVAPPSTDLRKVKTGTLFSEFRKEGSIVFQRFVDHLPPVGCIVSLHRVGAHRVFCTRVYTPKICLCWHSVDPSDTTESGLAIPFFYRKDIFVCDAFFVCIPVFLRSHDAAASPRAYVSRVSLGAVCGMQNDVTGCFLEGAAPAVSDKYPSSSHTQPEERQVTKCPLCKTYLHGRGKYLLNPDSLPVQTPLNFEICWVR